MAVCDEGEVQVSGTMCYARPSVVGFGEVSRQLFRFRVSKLEVGADIVRDGGQVDGVVMAAEFLTECPIKRIMFHTRGRRKWQEDSPREGVKASGGKGLRRACGRGKLV